MRPTVSRWPRNVGPSRRGMAYQGMPRARPSSSKAKGQGIRLVSSAKRDFDDLQRGARRQAKVVIEEQVKSEKMIMYVEAKRR